LNRYTYAEDLERWRKMPFTNPPDWSPEDTALVLRAVLGDPDAVRSQAETWGPYIDCKEEQEAFIQKSVASIEAKIQELSETAATAYSNCQKRNGWGFALNTRAARSAIQAAAKRGPAAAKAAVDKIIEDAIQGKPVHDNLVLPPTFGCDEQIDQAEQEVAGLRADIATLLGLLARMVADECDRLKPG